VWWCRRGNTAPAVGENASGGVPTEKPPEQEKNRRSKKKTHQKGTPARVSACTAALRRASMGRAPPWRYLALRRRRAPFFKPHFRRKIRRSSAGFSGGAAGGAPKNEHITRGAAAAALLYSHAAGLAGQCTSQSLIYGGWCWRRRARACC
jgi:hypothetical protein